MFSRRDRLSRVDFPSHGSQGRTLSRRSSPHFGVTILPEGHGYAVVVQKKLYKRAVDRHRLKRRVVGALRQPPPLLLPEAFILYPKAGALELEASDMRAELTTLLTRARS